MGRLLLILAALVLARPALACGPEDPCQVPGGFYVARTPANWDGKTALPVAVWFHGYEMLAVDIMHDQAAAKAFSDMGVLLVAPQGMNERWHLPVFNGPPRDDFAFVAAVMADVEQRFPIDHSRMLATGFSLGASMVWYLACDAPTRFTAYVAFSGAFWKPEPATCTQGPVNFLQIHGTADRIMPLAGRMVGNGLRQGDVNVSLDTMRRLDVCAPANHVEEDRTLPDGTPAHCMLDDRCGSGRRVEACFHPKDHVVIGDWYRTAWAFTEATKVGAALSTAR